MRQFRRDDPTLDPKPDPRAAFMAAQAKKAKSIGRIDSTGGAQENLRTVAKPPLHISQNGNGGMNIGDPPTAAGATKKTALERKVIEKGISYQPPAAASDKRALLDRQLARIHGDDELLGRVSDRQALQSATVLMVPDADLSKSDDHLQGLFDSAYTARYGSTEADGRDDFMRGQRDRAGRMGR